MSGPRHLWSGDWETEADRRRAERDARPDPGWPADEPSDTSSEPRGPRSGLGWRPTRTAVLTLVAVLVVAGVAVGVIAGSGGGNHPATAQAPTHTSGTNPFGFNPGGVNRAPTTPGQSTTPNQTTPGQTTPGQSTTPGQTTTPAQSAPGPVASEPTIDWLGMQVQNTGSDQTVVDTVDLTGAAQAAGIEPGDEIVAIDGTPVSSVSDIRGAVSRLKLGAQVTIAIARGSTAVTTQAILSGRPTTAP